MITKNHAIFLYSFLTLKFILTITLTLKLKKLYYNFKVKDLTFCLTKSCLYDIMYS